MVEPTKADIGRIVIYRAGHPNAPAERGEITSFNSWGVFVRFGIGATSQGCNRQDLEWETENPA